MSFIDHCVSTYTCCIFCNRAYWLQKHKIQLVFKGQSMLLTTSFNCIAEKLYRRRDNPLIWWRMCCVRLSSYQYQCIRVSSCRLHS